MSAYLQSFISTLNKHTFRLSKESHEFLTPTELEQVRSDPKLYLLTGPAYLSLFMPKETIALVTLVLATTFYKQRIIFRYSPITACLLTIRNASFAYSIGYCLLTDSVAFYKHVLAHEIIHSNQYFNLN